jgi:hypothetical protein
MAWYAITSGNWSTMANWNSASNGSGSTPADLAAFDNVTISINAGVSICCDVDMSGFANGLISLTISGSASTPAMVYSKHDADGTYHIKIKTGGSINGSSGANRGRLLANSDGVWGNTGALPFGRKFIIDLVGTANMVATYLDIQLYDTEPGIDRVATYGTIKTVTADATANTLTNNSHGWANATPLMVRSSGDLPAPLLADTVYYVVSTATNTFQLACIPSGTVIDLTSTGSGTVEAYSGHTSTSTGQMNVLTDVTGDPQWVSGAEVALVDTAAPESYDQQRTTISSVASGAITIGANVDSAQYPGATLILLRRNIAIRSAGTSSQGIIDFGSSTFTGSVIRCEIRNTSGSGTTFYGYGLAMPEHSHQLAAHSVELS